MAKKYQVKPGFLYKNPEAVTLVKRPGGKIAVALSGKEITLQIGGDKSLPPMTKRIPGATQDDLKYLFEIEKHPFIEEVEDTSAAVKS